MQTDLNTRRHHDALTRAEELADFIRPLRASGKSLRVIASDLTAAGIPTANGGTWGPKQVRSILQRLDQHAEQPPQPRDPLAALIAPAQSPLPPGVDPLTALPVAST